ncbi:MAG: HAMP domain-containing sensor histidine kinase [bacterium]
MEKEEKLEDKKTFLRVLKHQLKGPLTITKGYLSFWETGTYKKFPEEKQREFILKSLEGAKKLDYLLNDAFNALRLQAEEITPLIETFNIKELIENINESIKKIYHDKNIELEVHIPDNLEMLTTGKSSYQTVLEKIINNAFKFTNEGKVTVTIEQADGKTTVIVTDTGNGFSPEEIEHAFSPLFHGALSMYVIKGFTEKVLEGSVTLYSEGVNKGTKFTVVIPNILN